MLLLNSDSQNLPKISLTLSMWKKAKNFADQQVNYQKAQQVYLNTLALLSVNQYLTLIGIKTDLLNSCGYNLTMQTLLDNAELSLPEYGVIDCRPISTSDNFLIIPNEAIDSTIAHLVVAISQDFSSATFVGFTSQVEVNNVLIKNLSPIISFGQFLDEYQLNRAVDQQAQKSPQFSLLAVGKQAANISDWLDLTEEIIQKLGLRSLMAPEQTLVFRNSAVHSNMRTYNDAGHHLVTGVSKIKLWELGIHRIAIVVHILATTEDEVDFSIQIFPTENDPYLPVGITLKILDDSDKTILQIETTADNDQIEFCLSGQPQESFTIQGIYADQVQTERFII